MKTVVVGFDSAWTRGKRGAVAAVTLDRVGRSVVLQQPVPANFEEVAVLIESWLTPADRLLVLLDQPTIVPNESGCRQIERVVSSPISRARGGVQPASRGRKEMFGLDAPLWPFLDRVGGSLDPSSRASRMVIETYPALALLGLGWVCGDGSLYKYNPERRKTYRVADWEMLCHLLAEAFAGRGLHPFAEWCEAARAESKRPGKARQDAIDSLLCLLVGLLWMEGEPTLQIGAMSSGLMVVPDHCGLVARLLERLARLGWDDTAWIARIDHQLRNAAEEIGA